MSTRQMLDPETIRVRCAMIRSRWDSKTMAERHATATARQLDLVQQLGIGCEPTEDGECNAAAVFRRSGGIGPAEYSWARRLQE